MSIDLPGFADPVAGAQATFRAVLNAMSRPGAITIAGAALTPPPALGAAIAAALLTLADAETTMWLDPVFSPARDWIAFHCGAPVVDDMGAADFVVATSLPDLSRLNAGSDDGPEISATVILQVAGLGSGTSFTLSGPGLKSASSLKVKGLPADFATQWTRNHGRFPRGVDLVLCAGERIAALPRSVSVREG